MMRKAKALWRAACRRPAAALYLLGAAGLVLTMLAAFVADSLLYAVGVFAPQTITLADTGCYQLVNMAWDGQSTLTAQNGDAQLLLTPGQRVRTLRLVAQYSAAGSEMDLYWHLPGGGYSAGRRRWPVIQPDGSWQYTLPLWAGQNLRLDLADQGGVAVTVTAIVINEKPAWYTYFLPTPWQLFWLAAWPGLLACALALVRGLWPGGSPNKGGNGK